MLQVDLPQTPITDAAITALARLLLKRSAELDAEPMPEPLGTIAPSAAGEIINRLTRAPGVRCLKP